MVSKEQKTIFELGNGYTIECKVSAGFVGCTSKLRGNNLAEMSLNTRGEVTTKIKTPLINKVYQHEDNVVLTNLPEIEVDREELIKELKKSSRTSFGELTKDLSIEGVVYQ